MNNQISTTSSEASQKEQNQIILYRPNDTISLEVRLENETVWLSQAQMTELFGSTKQNISLHINNIFKEGELKQISVVKDFLTTALDGKKYRTKEIELLDNLSNNSIFGNQRTNFTYSKGFSIGTANILQDVEKSYDKGKFLLEESKKNDALFS